jgi:hypothetical protein
MNLSQSRKKLRGLLSEMEKTSKVFFSRTPLIKGTVYKTQTKCGSPNCRCVKEGQLHEVWRLSRSHKGKTQTRTLKAHELDKYKKHTRAYQKHRKTRARLVKLHSKILEVVDDIENEKRNLLKDVK